MPYSLSCFLVLNVSAPTPLEEKQPYTWIVAGCLTIGATQASKKLSPFLLRTSLFPEAPNKRNGASSEKVALPHYPLDQFFYFLQKLSLFITFFLDRKGILAALREARLFWRSRRRTVRAEELTPHFFHSSTNCWLLALK